MTRQQELELLAEWMGIEIEWKRPFKVVWDFAQVPYNKATEKPWNPSPEGNDTDFLNMVAGRVDFVWYHDFVQVQPAIGNMPHLDVFFKDHNNDKLAAMKHAAYQVCLMMAKEWKEAAR